MKKQNTYIISLLIVYSASLYSAENNGVVSWSTTIYDVKEEEVVLWAHNPHAANPDHVYCVIGGRYLIPTEEQSSDTSSADDSSPAQARRRTRMSPGREARVASIGAETISRTHSNVTFIAATPPTHRNPSISIGAETISRTHSLVILNSETPAEITRRERRSVWQRFKNIFTKRSSIEPR